MLKFTIKYTSMIIIIYSSLSISFPVQEIGSHDFNTFNSYCMSNLPTLAQLCQKKAINISTMSFITSTDYAHYRAISPHDFNITLDEFFSSMQTTSLVTTASWLNQMGDYSNEWLSEEDTPFKPYVQKIIFRPGDTVALRGDLHGDIHSLLNFLRYLQSAGYTCKKNGFKIMDPTFKIIFLGDYVDRGIYALEVLYILMRLKIANPDQVILIRGNHEDLSLNDRLGFTREVKNKFKDASQDSIKTLFKKLSKFYEMLPLAVYIGCTENESRINFAQCCHGGIEIGFDPKPLLSSPEQIEYQLIGNLYQVSQCKKLKGMISDSDNNQSYFRLLAECNDYTPKSPTEDSLNGFMWNDFQHDPHLPLQVKNVRGIRYNKEISEAFFELASTENCKLRALFRAHQHTLHNDNPLTQQMLNCHGVARHWSENSAKVFNPWQALVCTLLLSPDGTPAYSTKKFKPFNFDTTAFVNFAPVYESWKIMIVTNDIYADLAKLPDYQATIDRVMFYRRITNNIRKTSPLLCSAALALGSCGIYYLVNWAKFRYFHQAKTANIS